MSPFHLETGFFILIKPYFSLSFTIVGGVNWTLFLLCFCFFGALGGKGGGGGNGGAGGILFKLSSSTKDGAGGGGGGGGATILISIGGTGGGGGGTAFFVVWAITCVAKKLTTKTDMIFFINKFFLMIRYWKNSIKKNPAKSGTVQSVLVNDLFVIDLGRCLANAKHIFLKLLSYGKVLINGNLLIRQWLILLCCMITIIFVVILLHSI